jgi:ribonucleoside-diphosphate reductase alpha chain
VADIEDAYLEGWRLGLKAVAIYRENSKRSQPLATSKDGNTKKKASEGSGDGMATVNVEDVKPELATAASEPAVTKTKRRRLPDERPSVTHKFSIAGHEGYLHIGLYPDTQMPGEIFITMAKEGSTISGLMDAFATAISLSLQHGVPLEDMCRKFSHMRFEPSGFTTNRQIPIAKSVMDYIFRYLSIKFLAKPVTTDAQIGDAPTDGSSVVGATVEAFLATQQTDTAPAPVAPSTKPSSGFQNQDDAPPCSSCGTITYRAGACYVCPSCGSSTGCG